MLSSQPSGAVQEHIGRYQVLRKIATGGMAELFLAKQVGLDGFEKVVAIKRILAHLAHDQDFVQMFQDEARIVAQLSHPNIVQIYDLGKSEGTYFIAMEYIPGRNLSSIAKKARALQEYIPPSYIAHCLSQACEGLYYAHTRHDSVGQPLHIVHRDVSPQNIIVSFSGSVKLVDFGIAKAATKIAHTRAGVLKGKYAYMSPEQIRGEPTDARSDLFSVGIVLYELLCGRRPFEKENSIQTLKAIVQEDPKPSRSLNPDIPEQLDSIIERCLAKSPNDRFQTAQEVQLALEEFVSAAPKRVNNLAVSQWVTKLFEAEMGQGQSGTVNLPGLGNVVLPDSPAPADNRSPLPEDRPPISDDLRLSRGRGGGSVVAPTPVGLDAPASSESPSPSPAVDFEVEPGRSGLIKEGVIERPDVVESDEAYWDQRPTVYANGSDEGTRPADASESATRPLQKTYSSEAHLEPAPHLASANTEPRPFDDSAGFLAPLGGEAAFDADHDDPWDEATVGLPDSFETDDHDQAESVPSKGRARRPTQARLDSRRAEGGPTTGVGPSEEALAVDARLPLDPLVPDALLHGDEPSDPSHEIYAAAEASNLLTGDSEESATVGFDDPWGDKTAADPGLFGDDDDDDAVFVRDFEGLDADSDIELALEDGADNNPDPTIAQEPLPEDLTIDQRSFEENQDDQQTAAIHDPTVNQAALADLPVDSNDSPFDEAEAASAIEAVFEDHRTVAYEEAFDDLASAAPDRTVISAPDLDEAPTMGFDEELPRLDALPDFSTVLSMNEEPELPVALMDDSKTVAGVSMDAVNTRALEEPLRRGPSDVFADPEFDDAKPPREGPPPLKRARQGTALGAIRLDRRTLPEALTNGADPAEEATLGDPALADEALPPRPRGLSGLGEPPAKVVKPSPLEPPSDAEGSLQDEYSALVVPKPLGLTPAPAIGSTNVPPANLSLSQMLEHPPNAPRSRLTARPRASGASELGRPAPGMRSASVVGRQIREVVRSVEPPNVGASREPPPRLDLNSALDGPSLDSGDVVAIGASSRSGRRWLAPVLAAISVFLLAFAVYLALPYVMGPVGPHLTIKTTPVGARVLVDGTMQTGITPITISGLKPGVTYKIRLERAGYEAVDREVQLPESGPLIWQIPLRASVGVP